MSIISYPGGTGGNWLSKVLHGEFIESNSINFHSRTESAKVIYCIHELDPAKFQYLLSGKGYFNFYCNVIYKYFLKDAKAFDDNNYATSFLTCVDTAKYICDYRKIEHLIFFNYDHLVEDPIMFFNKVTQVKQAHNLPTLEYSEFLLHRQKYLDTCIDITPQYENFNSMLWCCFVIGQLMHYNIVPGEFTTWDPSNKELCKQYAKQNYHHCHLNEIYQFDSRVYIPEVI